MNEYFITDSEMSLCDPIQELQENFAKLNTDVALVSTFMRKSHHDNKIEIDMLNKQIKNIDTQLSRIIETQEKITTFLNKPWYKKIFKRYSKDKQNGK